MAQFISIPTQVVGQPNILFNADNITSVVSPTAGDTTATGLYCTLWMQSKAFRLTLCGSSTTIQNTNAIAAANIINNAIVSGNPAPICSPVVFPSVTLTAGSGSASQTTVTVASTAGLSVGMAVTVIGGQGAFALNTTIATITNATTFTVSSNITTSLAGATISAAVLTIKNIDVV